MGVHKTISFRMDADKVKALDQAAAHIQRDRTFLLNEAVDAWLDLHEYQSRLIDGGIKAAEEGHFVDNVEMRTRLAALKKSRKA